MAPTDDPVAAWHRAALERDAVGEWAVLRPFLVDRAWRDCSFDALRRSLENRLAVHAPLVHPLGYDWVVRRTSYEFPAEALNQVRILAALTGLNAQDRGSRIAARLANGWSFGGAYDGPSVLAREGWRFILVPFGWDDFLYLFVTALLAHARDHGHTAPFLAHVRVDRSWEPVARRFVLDALTLGVPHVAQLGIMDDVRAAVPWFADAPVGMADTSTPTTTALWSLVMDFVINHEVAHVAAHEGRTPRSAEELVHIEIEADHAAIDAFRCCPRPRFLGGLAANRSAGFYDLVSVVLGFVSLAVIATVGQAVRPGSGAHAGPLLQARLSTLLESYRRISAIDPAGLPSDAEWQEIRQLAVACEAFGRSLQRFLDALPAHAIEAATACADAARHAMEQELRDVAAGRIALPDTTT